jgi:hypothetical protein
VEIEKNDREKTAFYSGKRLMQFVKMPQGYKNSPAIFQRGMEHIFKDLTNTACIIYIDDILVFGCTEEEHNDNLEKVLKQLQDYDLQINHEKKLLKLKRCNSLDSKLR